MRSLLRIKVLLAALGALTLVSMTGASAATRPFYVITHMTNTPKAVDWSESQGANAVEVDVSFASNGTPTKFHHGGVCDCLCYSTVFSGKRHVCSQLGGFTKRCEANAPVVTLLRKMASKRKLALIIFDSKATDLNKGAQLKAARKLMPLVEKYLFRGGFRGSLAVGIPSRKAFSYLREMARLSLKSRYKSRIYFGIDMENGKGTEAADTMRLLTTLPSKNRVYGAGITTCVPGTYYDAISTAVKNMNQRSLAMAYIWSIDKKSSMTKYIKLGATGVMTNRPADLVSVARKRGLRLARPGEPLPRIMSNVIVGGGCDCDYHPGGCTISKRAPDGKACRCKYKGAWTCGGSVVSCSMSNPRCRRPDTSAASCVLGGGDCDGYKKASCDCNYRKGGCYISKAAPKGMACRCKYKGAWTCGGSVVKCKNPKSRYCTMPDKSKASCLLGGGDCKARRYK